MGSIPSRAVIRSKNHVNKRKQTMEEIIDMLAPGEAFLVCLGMAYLEFIANARQFRGFLLQCLSEFRRGGAGGIVKKSFCLGFLI